MSKDVTAQSAFDTLGTRMMRRNYCALSVPREPNFSPIVPEKPQKAPGAIRGNYLA